MIQKKKSKKVREGKRGRSEETCFHLDLPTRSLREKMPSLGSDWKKELAPMDFLPPAGKWPVRNLLFGIETGICKGWCDGSGLVR